MLHKVCTAAIAVVFASSMVAGNARAQNKDPRGDVTVGWTYLWADQGAGERSNLNGWYVRPAVNVGKKLSVFADFTNYYGANAKGSINSHGFTFGVSRAVFTRPRFRPQIFAELGDVRTSNAGSITHQLAVNAGGSFAVPLAKWVNLVVVPAEYIFLYPKGDGRNDFNAKAGLSFPIGRR